MRKSEMNRIDIIVLAVHRRFPIAHGFRMVFFQKKCKRTVAQTLSGMAIASNLGKQQMTFSRLLPAENDLS